MSLLLFFRRALGSGGVTPPEPESGYATILRPMKVREKDIDEALRLAFEKALGRQITREDEELLVIMAVLG